MAQRVKDLALSLQWLDGCCGTREIPHAQGVVPKEKKQSGEYSMTLLGDQLLSSGELSLSSLCSPHLSIIPTLPSLNAELYFLNSGRNAGICSGLFSLQ